MAIVSVPAYMPLLLATYLAIDHQFHESKIVFLSIKGLMKIAAIKILPGNVLRRIFTILEAVRSLVYQPSGVCYHVGRQFPSR